MAGASLGLIRRAGRISQSMVDEFLRTQTFEPGMPIEIVVDVNDLKTLPTIEVWQSMGATIIPAPE